jgi:riboflavin biosynthesis pyrimidine reductase
VTITVREAYDVDRPTNRRAWVTLCMIASLDGAVAVDGRSGPLGNANDLELLLTLRDLADVVVVGAGTARGEGYGPPRKPGLRVGVVTNSGSIDLTAPLFESGAGFVIAPARAAIDETRVDVLRVGRERTDLTEAIDRLGEIVPGARMVQAEGGPTLNAALLAADLIDELALSVSPRLVGGDAPRVTSGAEVVDRRFGLAHLLVDDDGFVFGRWTRVNPSAGR